MKNKKISLYLFVSLMLFMACNDTSEKPKTIKQENKIYKWKVATSWGSELPILADAVKNMTRDIEKMSNGQIQFEIYGARHATDKNGDIIETRKLWKAVSENDIQMMHATSYYWIEDIPGSVFFAAIPFGMTFEEMNSWFQNSNGLELWRDLYADYNLLPFPCGGSGNQMGGWFKKEIKSIDDFQGLKMRIAGLGGKVIERAGATSISVEQIKIKEYLENGYIDAAEWIGPYHDYIMNLNEVARYYYEPGWQEPNVMFELTVNKKAFEQLPPNLQEIIKTTSSRYNSIIYNSFIDKNIEYKRLLKDKNTEFRNFTNSTLSIFEKYSKEVVQEYIKDDSSNNSSIIYESYLKYQKEKIIIKPQIKTRLKEIIPKLVEEKSDKKNSVIWSMDNPDTLWGIIGLIVTFLTILFTVFLQIRKHKRFSKMLLQANDLLKDYINGQETSKKIVELRVTIGHFLEKQYIRETQYNVLNNKITEIQRIIDTNSTISKEIQKEIDTIISDGIISEKEYQYLLHLLKR